uniref:Uncharacterized protein n=1 Tax=Trypanosoma vivax (strain Y486) TaxID=1055687 RepID=G0TYB2_TRYVY|nr:hypothetical protein TVY486_0702910 [Trypanosoma vivax Y486]
MRMREKSTHTRSSSSSNNNNNNASNDKKEKKKKENCASRHTFLPFSLTVAPLTFSFSFPPPSSIAVFLLSNQYTPHILLRHLLPFFLFIIVIVIIQTFILFHSHFLRLSLIFCL